MGASGCVLRCRRSSLLLASSAAVSFRGLTHVVHVAGALGGRAAQSAHQQGEVDAEPLCGFDTAAGRGVAQAGFGAREFFRCERAQFFHILSVSRTQRVWHDGTMEHVTGIGGLFFRARDPKALGQWYRDHLGATLVMASYDQEPWQQEAGPTVFAPFPETTDYFGDGGKSWMVNFRVRSLDAIVAQLQSAGIAVKVDPEAYPHGRFARVYDPEGNAIELWEPAGD